MSKLTPQQAEAALQEALALHRQGQLAAAEKNYARILKSFPGPVRRAASARAAEAAERQGRRGAAADHDGARASIRRRPDALANLGLVLGALKRPAEALAHFDKALALDPDHFEALANRGNILLDLDRAEEALRLLRPRAGARAAPPAGAGQSRQRAAGARARWTPRSRSMTRRSRSRRTTLKALMNRASALFRAGRYGESIAGYDRLLALMPTHAEALSARGQALQAAGRHQDALASYAKAIALQKDFAHAHFNEALALLTVGEYRARLRAVRMALEARRHRAAQSRASRSGSANIRSGARPSCCMPSRGSATPSSSSAMRRCSRAPARRVIVEVQGELKDTARRSRRRHAWWRAARRCRPSTCIAPLGSLPLASKTELASVPAAIPYLRAERGAHRQMAAAARGAARQARRARLGGQSGSHQRPQPLDRADAASSAAVDRRT